VVATQTQLVFTLLFSTSEHHIFLLLQIPSCGSINDSTCVIRGL
jgi:hypothetical protein